MSEEVKQLVKKTIVVSGVNLVEAGTLAILRECLGYLSQLAEDGDYRIVAVVFKRELADFPNIEYIETQWPKKRWVNRLWFEYVSMKRISKQLSPIYLWLSLHDTTPNVTAERRVVYCHNPFPFYRWKWREWFFTPKIVLFALFSKYIYKNNIHRNNYVIVQQQWIRSAFQRMFGLNGNSIIVALPDKNIEVQKQQPAGHDKNYQFIFAASPNSHKNFECVCAATAILEQRAVDCSVLITVRGDENAYARWLKKEWGNVRILAFGGFMNRKTLFEHYAASDCLIFPSKVETWGLPISEFAGFDKPMLLADVPYAYETAAGADKVAFFDPDNPEQLAALMQRLIEGDQSALQSVPKIQLKEPVANNWKELFEILLK